MLTEQGKLPLGVTLSISEQYRKLTGQGEVWLDEAGLPLRLAIHLVYPAGQNGAHSEADLQTDFSGYPEQASVPQFSKDPAAWAASVASPSAIREVSAAGRWLLMFAGCLALAVLVVACRRSRRVYAATAIAVIAAMTVVPLMQNAQAAAYLGEQAQQQALAAASQAAEQKSQQAASGQASWDPHRDPLTAAPPDVTAALPPVQEPLPEAVTTLVSGSSACDDQQTADADKDGLTDYQECLYGTSTSTDDPDKDGVAVGFDTDADGLSDGQEVNYLGTDPTLADTDGDTIADTVEVQGFVYPTSGRHWYLDPRSTDTNGDGKADGIECPPLARGDMSATAISAECDADGDGAPNVFESDNDKDGVPDKVDLSPNELVDRSGVRTNGKPGASAFDRGAPVRPHPGEPAAKLAGPAGCAAATRERKAPDVRPQRARLAEGRQQGAGRARQGHHLGHH